MSGQRSDRQEPAPLEERTDLAWVRTALALLATAGLVIRAGFATSNRLLEVTGGAMVVISSGWWAIGRNRHAVARAARPGRSALSGVPLALVAAVTAAAGVTVLLTVLLSVRTDR